MMVFDVSVLLITVIEKCLSDYTKELFWHLTTSHHTLQLSAVVYIASATAARSPLLLTHDGHVT